jgi:hypothetical protein
MALLLTMEQAQAMTGPYHDLWVAAHREAEKSWWDRLRLADPMVFIAAEPTTRAGYIHDLVVHHVAVNTSGAVIPRDRLKYAAQLITDGNRTALVRFKLLDSGMNPRNHPSDQQNLLKQQIFTPEAMGQLQLEGISEAPTLLTCGYQLARDEMSISRILVVFHFNHAACYWYDLETGQSANVVQLPDVGDLPSSRIRSRRRIDESGTE